MSYSKLFLVMSLFGMQFSTLSNTAGTMNSTVTAAELSIEEKNSFTGSSKDNLIAFARLYDPLTTSDSIANISSDTIITAAAMLEEKNNSSTATKADLNAVLNDQALNVTDTTQTVSSKLFATLHSPYSQSYGLINQKQAIHRHHPLSDAIVAVANKGNLPIIIGDLFDDVATSSDMIYMNLQMIQASRLASRTEWNNLISLWDNLPSELSVPKTNKINLPSFDIPSITSMAITLCNKTTEYVNSINHTDLSGDFKTILNATNSLKKLLEQDSTSKDSYITLLETNKFITKYAQDFYLYTFILQYGNDATKTHYTSLLMTSFLFKQLTELLQSWLSIWTGVDQGANIIEALQKELAQEYKPYPTLAAQMNAAFYAPVMKKFF